MRTILTRIATLSKRRSLEADLNEEVASHLAMLEEEFRRRGMSPVEAKLAARREFGGVAQMQEVFRERRGIPWLEIAAKDFRYTLRGLRRTPGFTAAAVISLALGIGANTAIFSLFYSLMLRNLPVARPSELVTLRASGPTGQISYPLYEEIARRTDLFQGVFVADAPSEESSQPGSFYTYVSSNYFTVLGVKPAAGRFFTESDARSGEKFVVLSYEFWQRRYGGAADVVGRKQDRMPNAAVVIGVAPPGFRGVQRDRHPERWYPLEAWSGFPFQRDEARVAWAPVMARMRPGVSRAQAQAALDVLVAQHTARVFGDLPEPFRKQALARRVEIREGGLGLSLVREQFGKPLGVLMAAVAIVLLAACVNVAHLLLARGAARRREIAMRLSIGATRARLVRQALMEAFALALAGSALGGLLALWGRRYTLHFLPSASGDPFGAPDRAALAFAAGVSCLFVVIFALIPALRSTAIDPAAGLRGEGGGRQRRGSLRMGLVAAQVAFSVLLVALAALFGRSLGELRAAGLRFGDRDAIGFTAYFPSAQPNAAVQFRDAVLALPGVASISSGNLGLDGSTASSSVRVPGSARTDAVPAPVDYRRVAPGFFATLGATVLQGREFNRADAALKWDDAAIVNREFLKEFMPGERNPIGRTFQFAAVTLASHPEPKATRIIGVVEDIPHKDLRQRPEPTVYVQGNLGSGTALVATKIPAEALLPALRRELQKAGAFVISEPQTVRSRIEDSIFQDRILASLSWFFGGLTLLLAGVGLYGVVAYETVRRSGEIGVRVALGAERSSILWLILRGALAPVLIGLAVGLPAALAAGSAVRSILFGIAPGDPAAFISTACILALTGAAAALLPARRAAAMDPMRVLRHD